MTLVQRLVLRSVAVLIASLIAVGAGTAGALYASEHRAVDRTLLAAAAAHGHGGSWEPEHVRSPVRVAWADQARVSPAWIAWVMRNERPMWVTTRYDRVLLVLVEDDRDDDRDEDEGEDRTHDERHRVVVATAPRVTWLSAVGGFLVAFGVASGLVAGGAAAVLHRVSARALAPVSSAVATITAASGAAMGTRVQVQGPPEVAALLAAVDALLERRDDAFRAQRRFTANAAHELRTPVAAMLGELDVTLRRPRTAEQYTATLAAVRDNVRHLAALVDGLLLLARVDAGHAEQGRVREHAGALAEAAARRERGTVEAAGGTLTVRTSADPEVEVHEALVVAALANLLRNAAVHAPGSPVTLHVEQDGANVRFVVEDGGPGFAERPDAGAGLGLGLVLVRQIAQRHGGDCVVLDRPTGAAVAFDLPLPSADG